MVGKIAAAGSGRQPNEDLFMKIFGLAAGDPAVPGPAACGLACSIFYGSLSFGAVSVLAYSIWAFRLVPGTAGLYSTTALVYIGLAGLALSRLVVAPGAWKKFPPLFALAFFLYAVGWCAGWFGLKGKYHGDFFGALVGLAAMTWLLQGAFGQRRGFLRLFLVLFAFHSAGYYVGGELYALVRGTSGRLLWGAAHGLGFGAGLGYVLFHCQRPSVLK
jgi:hypothetical protein